MANNDWSLDLLLVAALAATALVMLPACDADVVLLQPEKAPAGDAITVKAQVSDTGLARRLGWTPGAGVPGALLRIRRDGDDAESSAVTDETGERMLPDLPAAVYWITAEKDLTGASVGATAPRLLAGGLRSRAARGATLTVEMRQHDPGSLVISELYYDDPPFAVTGGDDSYDYHYYVELFNNADTTVYLDGKILGGAFSVGIDISSWPCTETSRWSEDPRGLWAQSFQRFPGRGRDYPVPPGGVVVVAEQAIDHSAIYPGLPDLNQADFQFSWQDRAMNPDVPTMLPVQLRMTTRRVMGIAFHVPFIADVPDLASLQRDRNLQLEFALFPREAILDVAQIALDTYQLPRDYQLCGALVAPSLDALMSFAGPSRLHGDAHLLAAKRRLSPDGIHLQRTGVSAVDWGMGPRSPGRVP